MLDTSRPSSPRSVPRSLHESGGNPFLPIKWGYRLAISVFVVVFLMADPLIDYVVVGGEPVMGLLNTLKALNAFLLFLPILFYRASYGWLHPLIFPSLYAFAKSLGKDPGTFLSIFLNPPGPLEYEVTNAALAGWNSADVASAAVEGQLLTALATVIYYIGFFYGPRFRLPKRQLFSPRPKPKQVTIRALLVVGAAFALFVFYMQMRGGVITHMNTMFIEGANRNITLRSTRYLSVFIEIGSVAWIMWLALNKMAAYSPLFWLAGVLCILMNYVSTGSRAVIIVYVTLALIVWMLKTQKVPKLRIVVAGLFALAVISTLGEIRGASFGSNNVDWSDIRAIVMEEGITARVKQGSEVMAERSATVHGFLPIMAKVPGEVDFLFGKTYLGILTLPIPRAVWGTKPRTCGSYSGEILFGRTGGTSIPCGDVGEAFWNFHIPGVVVVFFLFGAFHQWLARFLIRYRNVPIAYALYALILMGFDTTAHGIVTGLQALIPAVGLAYFFGAFTLKRKNRPGQPYAAQR